MKFWKVGFFWKLDILKIGRWFEMKSMVQGLSWTGFTIGDIGIGVFIMERKVTK